MTRTLAETVAMELDPQYWPEDVKLFMPYKIEQILIPDLANCNAVEALLRFWKLPYTEEMRWNAEWMSPTGRVPFIKCGKFLVSDLEAIAQHCEKRNVKPSLPALNDMENSEIRAYISTINNVLYNAELFVCWADDETYSTVTSVRNGSGFPWPLSIVQNWTKRSKIIKQLKMYNWYEKSMDEVINEVEKCCQALSEKLGDKDYFFGSHPTELDALVFGHIFTIITTSLPGDHLANVVWKYNTLVNLTRRIEDIYFKTNLTSKKR